MWHTMEKEKIYQQLKTNSENGLDIKEVENRQIKFGTNKLKEQKKENIIIKFIKQFNDFMIMILIVASMISAMVSYIEHTGDYMDSMIIIAVVVLNSIMGLIQEYKAEKSLEALKKLSSPIAKVRRNKKIMSIRSEDIVPGDIIILEAGNFVPADCRITKSFHLKIEESSLTGETVPVLKNAEIVLKQDIPTGDMINMAFSMTTIITGHGEAIVTEIGMNTKVGKLAQMMIQDEAPETPLQKKLAEVGKKLGLAAISMCFVIFLIGVLKKISPIEMFMTSIGLAVAAIPEGLPAVVTIMLSIGVTKMAKKNAIIRKLPAVETLGSSQIICSDKTGTLTQNKMKVIQIFDAKGELDDREPNYKHILQLGSMCNNTNIIYHHGKIELEGEATETAIVNESIRIGEDKDAISERMERINEIPFDSTRKMMTTIHKIENKYRIVTKGAPDVLMKRCSGYYNNAINESITMDFEKKVEKYNNTMAEEALRVIGVAYRDIDMLPKEIDSQTIENGLIFVGLIGMMDPPREGVKEAVESCRHAGIKTVMITGDHVITAKAIAKQLGILNSTDKAITGLEIDKISQEKLEKEIMNYAVFARVSPEHKVKIVKAFQSNRKVVAMTGDGINDAPALKNADIGVAMGITGTDVAKNASDMILTDDNFTTIVEAVKEGRHIFDNIKKAVHFLIATNIGEIVTIFLGLLLGLESPLLAIQLLWVNLVTDSFPAIALGLEPMNKNIMNKKPVNAKKGIFTNGMWGQIATEGLMIGIFTLVAFSIGNYMYNVNVARTMAFITLGLLELVHSFNIRSDESIFKIGIFKNKYLIGAFVLGAILQIGVASIPQINHVFECVPLNGMHWMLIIGIAILPIILIEIQKKWNEIIFGKTIYANRLSQ